MLSTFILVLSNPHLHSWKTAFIDIFFSFTSGIREFIHFLFLLFMVSIYPMHLLLLLMPPGYEKVGPCYHYSSITILSNERQVRTYFYILLYSLLVMSFQTSSSCDFIPVMLVISGLSGRFHCALDVIQKVGLGFVCTIANVGIEPRTFVLLARCSDQLG